MPYVPNAAPETKAPPTLTSARAAAIDIDSGYVLYLKNAQDVDDFPASTVKMMTALLAAEAKSGVLDSETVTWQSSDDLDPGYTQVGFQDGDVVTWRDLLCGLMMVSGGDAAQAIARVLGNEDQSNALTSTAGYAAFVDMMNAKASAIGMTDRSSFSNSHGADRHKMTTRDLAVLAGACFSNATIAAIMSAALSGYTINVTGPNARAIPLTFGNSVASDANVDGRSKTGGLIYPSLDLETYTLATLWTAPAGNRVAIATLGSDTSANRFQDTLDMIAALPADFPHLSA